MNPLSKIKEHNVALELLRAESIPGKTLTDCVLALIGQYNRQTEAVVRTTAIMVEQGQLIAKYVPDSAGDAIVTYFVPYQYLYSQHFNGVPSLLGCGYDFVTFKGGITSPTHVRGITEWLQNNSAGLKGVPNVKVIPLNLIEISREKAEAK